jgi:surfeit locus 1 family protein
MTSKAYKSFRPGRLATGVLFSLTLLFVMLGSWQVQRAAEKKTTEQQHQSATRLSLDNAIAGENRFSQIQVSGHYDTSRHFLLDNQIWQGRGGVYVFTPFVTVSGTKLLINRGWLPLAPDRKTMPEIQTPDQEVVITGMLNILPVPGRMLGSADVLKQDEWPQLVTYLNLKDMSDSLDLSLENWIIQLSKTEQTGFEGRDWKPVFLSSNRHKAYAFQWFALATASIMMWIYTGFRKPSADKP